MIETVGGGLRTAITALVLGRMGIGAVGVAMSQAAFDFSTDYMTKRKVFGQELAKFQHWQFKFAEHALQIAVAAAAVPQLGRDVVRPHRPVVHAVGGAGVGRATSMLVSAPCRRPGSLTRTRLDIASTPHVRTGYLTSIAALRFVASVMYLLIWRA